MDVLDYNLPDAVLYLNRDPGWRFICWIPTRICIVLGASNKVENSLHLDAIESDSIPVYKRQSGGETVMLTPDMLIISAIQPQSNKLSGGSKYFQFYNSLIIAGLAAAGIPSLGFRGISDVAIGEKKILGSAIYQNKYNVFYHAVLNVAGDVQLFNRYLQHPKREPDYRQGRTHEAFVTSIYTKIDGLSLRQIQLVIESEFNQTHQQMIQ